jgi:hypothetical protein
MFRLRGRSFCPRPSPSSMRGGRPSLPASMHSIWAIEIQKAADNGDSTWPVIRRKLNWRSKVSITLMRANAQMLFSRATRQKTLCPAHAHRTAPASRISLCSH